MGSYLILRFEGPMQAWGSEAIDPRRPSGPFPRLSAVAGLLGNALGWRHRDVDRLNHLQDALRLAAREDRAPERMWDYQTADLSRLSGFGRWGPMKPGGGSKDQTHLLLKEYLADAHFTVALGLDVGYQELSVADLSTALRRPARPLFLGRKSCPPAAAILREMVEADSPLDALGLVPLDEGLAPGSKRIWWSDRDAEGGPEDRVQEIWQRRNYRTARFDAMHRVLEGRVEVRAAEE